MQRSVGIPTFHDVQFDKKAMLGVSRATIYRCRIEFGLSGSGDESNITDQQLESILRVEKLLLLARQWP